MVLTLCNFATGTHVILKKGRSHQRPRWTCETRRRSSCFGGDSSGWNLAHWRRSCVVGDRTHCVLSLQRQRGFLHLWTELKNWRVSRRLRRRFVFYLLSPVSMWVPTNSLVSCFSSDGIISVPAPVCVASGNLFPWLLLFHPGVT